MSRVEHPDHYQTESGIEAIEVIEAFFPDSFHLGNVFKYIARAGKKSNRLEDLQKAAWYLQREIDCHATETTTQAAKKELPSVIFGPMRQEKRGANCGRH